MQKLLWLHFLLALHVIGVYLEDMTTTKHSARITIDSLDRASGEELHGLIANPHVSEDDKDAAYATLLRRGMRPVA